MNKIPLQLELSPALPNVYGALDYREFRETLIKIDEILTKKSSLERYEKCFDEKLLGKEIRKWLADLTNTFKEKDIKFL